MVDSKRDEKERLKEKREKRNIGAKDARKEKVRKDECARANLVLSVLRSALIFLPFSFLVHEEDRNTSASQTTRSSATARKMVGKVEGRTRGLNKSISLIERDSSARGVAEKYKRERETFIFCALI